ncbi:hypothetical protein ACFONG_15405 [Uliginosibacterium paludis]|uniref:Lipoprotein n=1 Tax=Uliginosibacterium paludis TaxID=1615952 RepID=A0ABV2CTK2_9RHOO
MRRWLVLVAGLGVMGGCGRTDAGPDTAPGPVEPTPAATVSTPPAPARASGEGTAEALMQLAFPGWSKSRPSVVRMKPVSREAEEQDAAPWVKVTPALRIPLAEDRIVLLVAGRPSTDEGVDQAGHASPANLGAYWFRREAGGWRLAASQASFVWTGFFGEPGELHPVKLSSRRQGVAVSNGSCWQGQCGEWLSVFEIGDGRVTPLLGGQDAPQIVSDVSGATEACSALLAAGPGSHRVEADAYSDAYGCFTVKGEWLVRPGDDAPGELEIRFSGHQASAASQAPAETSAPAPQGDGAMRDVSVSPVSETVVYRFRNGRYELASGRNPAPSF